MADHGGQPVGEMDVTDLEVSAEGGATPIAPANILPPNTTFQLKATFSGRGLSWNNMKARGLYYEATFYAEGVGAPPYDTNFGTAIGHLGPDPQQVTQPVTVGLPRSGLYRLGVVVSFPPDPNISGDAGWPGYVGYYEGLIVQVSTQA